MESVATNKFELQDIAGTNTLAFVVEKDFVQGEEMYGLQRIECVEKKEGIKEFCLVNDTQEPQDIVLVTLTKNKAILSSGILDDKGLSPTKDSVSLSYGSLFNADGIEYKDFVYTPNMKRRFTIIDTINAQEVMPSIYMDNVTNEIKGKCRILPLRPYVIIEVGK